MASHSVGSFSSEIRIHVRLTSDGNSASHYTALEPRPKQATTPPSLLVMERELQVLEGEQAVDPTNAARAGRISGLKHDIGRKRRRL